MWKKFKTYVTQWSTAIRVKSIHERMFDEHIVKSAIFVFRRPGRDFPNWVVYISTS